MVMQYLQSVTKYNDVFRALFCGFFSHNNDRQKEIYHSRNTCSSFLIKMADTIQSKQFGHKWKWILMSANIIEIYMKSNADNRKKIYTVWLKYGFFKYFSLWYKIVFPSIMKYTRNYFLCWPIKMYPRKYIFNIFSMYALYIVE